mmetsp:Transcript_3662/g.10071  ORF Transcript_3662/g.10071 Transcript_3662/m.10071 type:complete len:285 (+) Transcript_3662:3-857(+)
MMLVPTTALSISFLLVGLWVDRRNSSRRMKQPSQRAAATNSDHDDHSHYNFDHDRRHKLFVYGTLKRGFFNHQTYLHHGETSGAALYLGNAQTVDQSFRLQLVGERKIPALIENEEEDTRDADSDDNENQDDRVPARIRGQVFAINDAALQAMDLLEGVATGHYYRVQRDVEWVPCCCHDDEEAGNETSNHNHNHNHTNAKGVVEPCWIYLQKQSSPSAVTTRHDGPQQQHLNDSNHPPPYTEYTPELHQLYVPPTAEPDAEILRLLQRYSNSNDNNDGNTDER